MKDATGELSMTAVAVVAIGLISTLFLTIVWPQIRRSIMQNTYCSSKFNCTDNGDGTASCSYYDDNGAVQTGLQCPVTDN